MAKMSDLTTIKRERLRPNIMDKSGGLMANSLLEMLRDKKISLAAAVTGKELTHGITALLPGVFKYLFNSGPLAVRETVLEIPREYLHENGGVSRCAAMYMAHNVTAICEAEAGFALIVEAGRPQAVMAFCVAGQILCQEFTFPDNMNEHEQIEYACRCSVYFCNIALEAYPDDIPDSVPASDILAGEEASPSAFSLLRQSWRRTGA